MAVIDQMKQPDKKAPIDPTKPKEVRKVPVGQQPVQQPGFNQISPNLGEANIQPQQVDPTTGQPMTPQTMPQPKQQTGNPIQSKIRSLYDPLPPVQQVPTRRIFRILPIKRRTSF